MSGGARDVGREAFLGAIRDALPEPQRSAFDHWRAGTTTAEEVEWRSRRRQFSRYLARLSEEQAQFVRHLRVEVGASYRAIAKACYEAWGPDARRALWGEEVPGEPGLSPSHQSVGHALCAAAARHFGEDYNREPWQ